MVTSQFRERWTETYARVRFRVSSLLRWQREQKELLFPAIGMFIFYICHDALQEEMFRLDGFEFGWFMTLSEVTIMLIGAVASEGVSLRGPPGGGRTWLTTGMIGLCVSLSHGCGNTAIRFSSYPLKVAFKSCKLVPTMLLGVFLTGRHFSVVEYMSALIMCLGLVVLSIADVDFRLHEVANPEKAHLGPILLALSTSFDAIVPNLQERLFRLPDMKTGDMIFLSNVFMFFILFVSTFSSGELVAAVLYLQSNPRAVGFLCLQSISAYFGLRCYLTVVKRHGGVAGVLLSNARKIITILLSFILFAKPCHIEHVFGLLLIFLGVYLGLQTKRKAKVKPSPVSNGETDDGHEHAV